MSTKRAQKLSERSRVLVASVMVIAVLVLPAVTRADTSIDLQGRMITLLTTIVQLQKQLIEMLTLQNTQLELQIAVLSQERPLVSTATSTTHTCAVVDPPTCPTTLTATYDSYGCVTAYSCTQAETPLPTVTTGQQIPVQDTAQTMSHGCWASGKWYPDGARAWSGDLKGKLQAVTGSVMWPYVICTGGIWFVEGTRQVVVFPR